MSIFNLGILGEIAPLYFWLLLLPLLALVASLLVVIYMMHWRLRSTAALARERRRLRRTQRVLSYEATHDALTGLVNRSEFERRLAQMRDQAQAGDGAGALLYLDLDRFKVVNDRCGHLAGDQLLRRIAELLGQRVRKHDTLARLGGDEFGVLLQGCAQPEALRVARDLQEVLRALRFTWQDKTFTVGVSIGVALVDGTGSDVTAMLAAADQACYQAKDAGRNRIEVAVPGQTRRRETQLHWLERIRQGKANGRLRLYRQMIAPRAAGGEYYEILLRLEGENGRLHTPEAFLPAAERHSLMADLDRWVVERTFAWLAAQPARLESLAQCFINLSMQSVDDLNFPAFIRERLERFGIGPEKICFEITEAAATANLGQTIAFMGAVGALGCRCALDDFAPVSFAYLRYLPVDFIKINGELVADVADDPVNHALVSAIQNIGRVMGKRAVAECVESPLVREHLEQMGVDFLQGYGIARPQPLQDSDDQVLPANHHSPRQSSSPKPS